MVRGDETECKVRRGVEWSSIGIGVVRDRGSILCRLCSKEAPHFPHGGARLCQLRLCEIEMKVIQMCCGVLTLRDGIPSLVSKFPLILIGDSERTSAQRFQTDWGVRTEDDGDRMDVVPWSGRVHGVRGEMAFPSRELEDAVVGHAFPHVFQLRGECHDITSL